MINHGAREGWGPGLRTSVVMLLLFFGSISPVAAQEAGGTIVGTVTDPSGAAVANANVTVKNVATGVERNSTTNADGVYAAPNLIPGAYEITVTATGFATAAVQGVGLLAGERREVNVDMKLGQVSDKVSVVSSEI